MIKVNSDKLAEILDSRAKEERLAAYRAESDPVFFAYQAGEATREEWLATRQQVRDRFPGSAGSKPGNSGS